MLKNHIIIAFRNLWRQKGYTLINIIGLTIGIACCILILLYVADEISYDRHHEKADHIYRIGLHGIIGPNEFNGAISPAPMAEVFVEEIPEVIAATRIRSYGFPVLKYKEKVFSEELFYWADSTIFDIFTIPFLQGDPKTALSKPRTMVITKSMAEKYFGDENPMEKLIHFKSGRSYMITGVIEDLPQNSHFHFDFLGSLVSYQNSLNDIWISNNFYTYVLLHPDATRKDLEAKLPLFVDKYAAPQIESATGTSYEQMKKSGSIYEWFLQPLTDIHLYSNLEHEIEPNGNATYVYIFTVIAFGVLIIACINFMNLATARSAKRAREVGVRKTLGSTKIQLIVQFLSESIFLTFIALVLALMVVRIILPSYNMLIGKQLSLEVFDNIITLPLIVLFTIFVGILAGSYPAFFMSSFKPVVVLKGKIESGQNSYQFLRSGLVIFQFAISIFLIAGTIIVADQLNYLQMKNLGFNKEQLIVVEKTDDIAEQLESFKFKLRNHPSISGVSNSTHYIGQNFSSNAFKVGGPTNNETHLIWNMWTDHDFASTFQVEMKQGRYYSREFSTDTTGAVLNQSAVNVFGLNDPLGKEIVRVGPTQESSENLTIIGVMKDFHFESLHYQIRPLIILPFRQGGFGRYVAVRIATENIHETLQFIESTWKNFAENQAFEYFFFDEEFARLYASEQQTGTIITIFSVLAIFIACLGLFGLASFSAEKRTKEIGVRKVMGATIVSIVFLQFKETVKLIAISNVIALPLLYFVMDNWLHNFAYRITIGAGVFFFTIFLAFLVAILTVSYQSLKAAMLNPTAALRYE
jgi:putative ABC transport system permease protein